MTTQTSATDHQTTALPPIVDQDTWEAALAELRVREKAATRELDAIAAARRRLPMVELPDYTLDGPDGPVRLVDVFEGKRQLIVYNHMWFPGEEWQCSGCTGFTSQFTRLEFLDAYDARFVIVTQGPIDEALAYKARVGNRMDWYSTANSPFGSDMGAPPDGGFQLNVFLRVGDTVVPHVQHPGPRRGAGQPHVPADRPAALRTPGGVAGLARPAGPSHPPTPGGPPPRTSPATPTTPEPPLGGAVPVVRRWAGGATVAAGLDRSAVNVGLGRDLVGRFELLVVEVGVDRTHQGRPAQEGRLVVDDAVEDDADGEVPVGVGEGERGADVAGVPERSGDGHRPKAWSSSSVMKPSP